MNDQHQEPGRPDAPDEPVDPDLKQLPERDQPAPEEYVVPDADPEAPADEPQAPGAEDADDLYPRESDEPGVAGGFGEPDGPDEGERM